MDGALSTPIPSGAKIYSHKTLDISNEFWMDRMYIRREAYLSKLNRLKHKGGVKIITGLRRVGKTHLLFNQFYSELLSSGVPEDHIIRIGLDSIKDRHLRDPLKLYNEIDSRIVDDAQYYVMIDEIQMSFTVRVKNIAILPNPL